jgi:hypothetical protein
LDLLGPLIEVLAVEFLIGAKEGVDVTRDLKEVLQLIYN